MAEAVGVGGVLVQLPDFVTVLGVASVLTNPPHTVELAAMAATVVGTDQSPDSLVEFIGSTFGADAQGGGCDHGHDESFVCLLANTVGCMDIRTRCLFVRWG